MNLTSFEARLSNLNCDNLDLLSAQKDALALKKDLIAIEDDIPQAQQVQFNDLLKRVCDVVTRVRYDIDEVMRARQKANFGKCP